MTDKYARVWSGTEWVNVSSPIASPNAVAVYQSTAPSSPVTGQIWVDSDDNASYVWNGSSWGASPNLSLYAPIASPTFTGTTTVPTLSLTTADTATAATHYMVETATDGVVRPKTLANVKAEVVVASEVLTKMLTVDGAGSGLDADILDGIPSSHFVYGTTQAGSKGASVTQNFADEAQWKSGFWEVSGASWTPNTNWFWGLTMAHTSGGPAYLYGAQLAAGIATSDGLYFRTTNGGPTPSATAWNKVAFLSSPTFTGTVTAENATVSGLLTVAETTEVLNTGTIASNVFTANFSTGGVFYITTAPAANFTINVTNLPTTDNRVTVVSFFVIQGATGFIPNALQIGGVAQTIKWSGGTAPTATNGAGKVDNFTFTFVRRGAAWEALGTSNRNF